jgi:hypothetical protein
MDKSWTWWRVPVIPATTVKVKWEDQIQANLDKKQVPSSKITSAKRTRGVAQVVEHLFSKCEALNSNPNTTKKTQKFFIQ